MRDPKSWHVGDTSSVFESNGHGPGTVSTGTGDHGGVSYGTYQLSSKAGTAAEYVRQSRYSAQFKGMKPGGAEFSLVWKYLANDDPGFGIDQHDFIRRTHYLPRVDELLVKGIDVEARGPAVQDMVWSTSVQYRGLTASKIERGLRERFGQNFDLASLSDLDIVDAVQMSKLRHVGDDFRSSPKNLRGLETRIAAEKLALAAFAVSGEPATTAEMNAYWVASLSLSRGDSGKAVADVQEALRDLGYLAHNGAPIVPDGHFGSSTYDALMHFQLASGIGGNGQAGALTVMLLKEQVQARDLGVSAMVASHIPKLSCHIDDALHPDHANFLQTRVLVHQLDREHQRVPDNRSDNLAASIVVAARFEGMKRIDMIKLSESAEWLYAIQRMKGDRHGFLDISVDVPTVTGLNTSIERSSEQWPGAMRQFEVLEEQTQQRMLDLEQSRVKSSDVMQR